MKLICSALSFCISIFASYAQDQTNDNSYRVAFYNLENLFNPENDTLKNDDEFTPDGRRNWSYYRYKEKSNRMAKAILSIGGWEAPAIVGVAEIEDRKVLEDLVNSNTLRKFNYGIIHYESPDRRGIDVAALYRKDIFEPVHTKNVAVKMPDDPQFATRDILYIKGHFKNSDTVHLFFNHWPSRYGGQEQSEPKRIQAAITARSVIDSLFKAERNPAIVLLGDFNDEWNNISMAEYLKAKPRSEVSSLSILTNLMADMNKDSGSHRYRGTWSYLDQIIVSEALLDGKSLDLKGDNANVLMEDFLLEEDDRYPGLKPFRSFIGMRYNGGFSDHLPVYIDITTKSKGK